MAPMPPTSADEGRRWDRRRIALVGGALVGSLLVLAVIGYVVGALGTPAESPEATATESARPSPTPRPTPSPTPAVSPAVHVGFQYGDVLRVVVDGLAVREAPLLSSPLVSGYRYSLGYAVVSEPVAEVRLEAGNIVGVELGPLQIGDTSWYQVWSAGRVQDPAGDTPAFDYSWSQTSWVAGSVGDDQYMTLHQRPDPHDYVLEPFGPDGPRVFTVSGTGDYESGSQPRYDMFNFRWAISPDNHPAPCAFSISLIPENGPQPAVVVDTSTSDFKQGPRSGPNSIRNLPWGQSAGGPWDSYKVSIRSGCTWAMTLVPLYHE